MKSAQVTLKNKYGLHMRPAQGLMKLALEQPCNVYIEKDGFRANARSIVELISLAAECGQTLTVHCDGPDEEASLEKIVEFLENLPELYEEERVED